MDSTTNQTQSEGQYNFHYLQDDPFSLTMTKKPQIIKDIISQQSTYVWVFGNDKLSKQRQQQIQQKAELKINFVKLVKTVKQKFQKQKQQIILICHNSLIKQVADILQQMIIDDKIKCLIFYGRLQTQVQKIALFDKKNTVRYIETEEKTIQLIKEDKYIYSKGNFVNFILMNRQVYDSNVLVQTIIAMINQTTCSKSIINDLCVLAKYFFPGYSVDIDRFSQLYQNKNCLTTKQAARWYTKESFVYQIVNRILRISRDPTCLFIVQPYFKDLFRSVNTIYTRQQKKHSYVYGQKRSYREFTCYRGGEISVEQIEFFKQNQNQLVQNLGFFSTSRQKKEAQKFLKNALFEIEVKDQIRKPQLDFGFADVCKYSQGHQQEQQILFNPLNSFQIVGFDECFENNKIVYKIKLKYGQLAKVAATEDCELTEQQKGYKWLGEHQITNMKRIVGLQDVLIHSGLNLQGCDVLSEKIIQLINCHQNQNQKINKYLIPASIAYNKMQYHIAEQYYKQCLKMIDGEVQLRQEYFNIMQLLGWCYMNMQQFEKALNLFDEIEKETKKQGQSNIQYANILSNFGQCYLKMSQYQKAKEYFERSINILRQLQGQNHLGYLLALHHLGACYFSMYQNGKAIQYFQKCLQLTNIILGDEHPHYSIVLNDLGDCLFLMGAYNEALKFYESSQKTAKKIFGVNHPKYAMVQHNLGNYYQQIEQYQTAEKYYLDCLQLYKINQIQNHSDYAQTMNSLGICYVKMEEYEKALECLNKSQKIIKQKMLKNNQLQAQLLICFEYYYIKMNKFSEAADCQQRYWQKFLNKQETSFDQSKYCRYLRMRKSIEKYKKTLNYSPLSLQSSTSAKTNQQSVNVDQDMNTFIADTDTDKKSTAKNQQQTENIMEQNGNQQNGQQDQQEIEQGHQPKQSQLQWLSEKLCGI